MKPPQRGDSFISKLPENSPYICGDEYTAYEVIDGMVHYHVLEPDGSGFGQMSVDRWHKMAAAGEVQ
jgi:hypothetical protein